MSIWDGVAGAGISAGGSLLGSVFGGIFGNSAQKANNRTQIKIAEMNNRANRELAEYSYSKDLEQWNRQNEYNSPSAQMQRYAEAGLNPNLIYGSSGSAGNATSSPSYNAPTMQGANTQPVDSMANALGQIGNTISMFNNLRLQDAQIKKINADTNLSFFNSLLSFGRSRLANQQYGYLSQYNPLYLGHLRDFYPLVRDSYALSNNNKRIESNLLATKGEIMEQMLIASERDNQNWSSLVKPLILGQIKNLGLRNKRLEDYNDLQSFRKTMAEAGALDAQSRSGISWLDYMRYLWSGMPNYKGGFLESFTGDRFNYYMDNYGPQNPWLVGPPEY